MSHVVVAVEIPTDVEVVWREIGSFQAIDLWHPGLASVRATGDAPGDQREAVTRDGHRQLERLRENDARRHYYRYVIESSFMPVRNYEAELRADPAGVGMTVVHWMADFDLTDGSDRTTVPTVQEYFATGLEHLQSRYEARTQEWR